MYSIGMKNCVYLSGLFEIFVFPKGYVNMAPGTSSNAAKGLVGHQDLVVVFLQIETFCVETFASKEDFTQSDMLATDTKKPGEGDSTQIIQETVNCGVSQIITAYV